MLFDSRLRGTKGCEKYITAVRPCQVNPLVSPTRKKSVISKRTCPIIIRMEENVLYHIIDANFNRGREALRVMEEYCRFGLNHAGLSGRAKQCRHRLCEALGRLDRLKLLANRDVAGDVGREMKVAGQLSRQSLQDCFIAASKRASEALRALAEATQSIDTDIAAVMEQLRFEVYALEQETVLKSFTAAKWADVRLYVIINANPNTPQQDVLNLAKSCIAGGADCLQLRAKDIPDKQLLNLAGAFCSLCKESSTISIINDRVDIAVLSGADGVHLGQDDISTAAARKLAPMPLIIGVSTHNHDELTQAVKSAPDYIAIGPAFPSPTKPGLPIAGPEYLKSALPVLNQAGIPHVAIGGIDQSNLTPLLDFGIKTIAISAAVCNTENTERSCKALKTLLLD